MLRLALHGGLFSGKTTLADALVTHSGFQKIDYTGLLKTFVVEALKAVGVEVTIEDILANKEYYRPLIIDFGHVIGFDDGYGIKEILERLPEEDSVVFDNVRFDAQFEKLEAAGFILVRITTPMHMRVARAIGKGISRSEFARCIEDSSEAPLREYPNEVRIHVDGPIETVIDDLTAKILNLQLAQKQAQDAAAGQAAAESAATPADAEELPVVATTRKKSRR